MKCVFRLPMIATLLFLAACGRQHRHHPPVEWPALHAFDHEAERAEARVDAGADEAERHALSRALLAAGDILLDSPIPANVLSRSAVEARLQDVRDLLELLQTEGPSPDLLKAFDPVAHALMDAAGVPHVHEHDHAHGHDHAPDHESSHGRDPDDEPGHHHVH